MIQNTSINTLSNDTLVESDGYNEDISLPFLYTNFALGCVGASFNIFLLVIYWHRLQPSHRKKLSNLILANQGCVDLYGSLVLSFGHCLSGLLYCPRCYTDEGDILYSATTKRNFQMVDYFTYNLSLFSTIFHFVLMTSERCLAMCKPLYHHTNITKKVMPE